MAQKKFTQKSNVIAKENQSEFIENNESVKSKELTTGEQVYKKRK